MFMKKLILGAALLLAAMTACRQVSVRPRPTIPLVHAIVADSTGAGALVARSGRPVGEGSIAIST